ncbi:hypothetical protein B0T20DRAFT_10333 [Sordaria brevicollis]|uniref:Uncharacterized protein n=1 Tax=Sordaria brevicollis TaxID=83679 RepID=A0AAE0UG39_SORBR|nr:hypothetical protein B0T20DRAFT_10333 [Sordaria brevicollis]
MPGRRRAYTTEQSSKSFKWFPWKREKKVVEIEPVWSDWVSSEDGSYFYRARKLADGTWGDYEYTEGYYMGGYAEGYGGGYGGGYDGGMEVPQEKEYHPAVAVSSWNFPGEPAAIMPDGPEIMDDPEPRDAEIAESEPIGEFSAADDEDQNQGTTTNATSVSGDEVSERLSVDDGYRESEPLPTVQEAEPMVFTREPEPVRALSPVPSLRREYKPKRRHTTGADTSVPYSHHRPRVPHRHTFSEGQQKEGHNKDSHSHDHHHHHKRTKSHDPQSHKQPLLFSIFYAVTKTHAGPQTRRMPSSSPHRAGSSTHGKSTRASTRPSTARTSSSSSSRSPSVSARDRDSNKHDISSTRVAVPKTSTQKPSSTKKLPVVTKPTKPKKLTVPTASETTVVVPLDTGVPSVIAPPGKATITKTKKFNSKIKSEKEMKVDSKKMIKGWLAGMEAGAEEKEKKVKTKTSGKEGRGRGMTK